MALAKPPVLWTCLTCGAVVYDWRRECYGCEPERKRALGDERHVFEGELPTWDASEP